MVVNQISGGPQCEKWVREQVTAEVARLELSRTFHSTTKTHEPGKISGVCAGSPKFIFCFAKSPHKQPRILLLRLPTVFYLYGRLILAEAVSY